MAAPALPHSSLAGQVAVITGATQGLGEAVAHLFAARGCAGLVITGRNAERGHKVQAELQAKGVKTICVAADLGAQHAPEQIIAAADRAFGRIDCLVNAAGVTDRGSIWNTDHDLFEKMMAVNVRAPFFLMQNSIKIMQREKIKGSIVNILSMSAHGGQSFLTPYSVSKGALLTLTKNAAFSLLRHQIRVNGLAIGWMDTPGEDQIMKSYHGAGDNWLAKAEVTRPVGRLLKTAEVARACAYLASAESGLMTGAIIDFDQQVVGACEGIAEPPSL